MKTASLSLRLLRALLTFCWWACIVLSAFAFVFSIIAIVKPVGPQHSKNAHYTFSGYAHRIDLSDLAATTRQGSPVAVSIEEPVKIKLSLPSEQGGPSGLFLAGLLTLVLVVAGVVLFFLQQLRGIVATVAEGDPFVRANARRLRVLGVLILVLGVIQPLAEFATSLILRSQFVTQDFQISTRFGFEFSYLFAGLSVLVLAEVFRHGAALREEQALTV
jgi:hypothetical protein